MLLPGKWVGTTVWRAGHHPRRAGWYCSDAIKAIFYKCSMGKASVCIQKPLRQCNLMAFEQLNRTVLMARAQSPETQNRLLVKRRGAFHQQRKLKSTSSSGVTLHRCTLKRQCFKRSQDRIGRDHTQNASTALTSKSRCVCRCFCHPALFIQRKIFLIRELFSD